MSSLQRIILQSTQDANGFKSVCDLAPGQLPALNNLIDYLGGVSGGNYSAKLNILVGAVQALATFTFSSTGPTNGQTCTVGNTTFTAVTSGATANQFNISATPSVVAANFAAAINASTQHVGVTTAAAVGAVVTLTSVVPGLVGNALQLAVGTLSNTAVVAFAGGTSGTPSVLNFL